MACELKKEIGHGEEEESVRNALEFWERKAGLGQRQPQTVGTWVRGYIACIVKLSPNGLLVLCKN